MNGSIIGSPDIPDQDQCSKNKLRIRKKNRENSESSITVLKSLVKNKPRRQTF